jgi:predicted AlkP superfamily pyrophosphatase or phosphodiesterase
MNIKFAGAIILFIYLGLANFVFAQSSNKIVLINIRGASKHYVDLSLKNKTLTAKSAFRFLTQNGQIATSLEPVANAVTAVNNATLETGVYPATHGIVGNSFGRFVRGKFENLSGFGVSFLSETIWEKAARQGKKVIRLGTLQVNGFGKNDFSIPTLPQVAPLSPSQIVNLKPTNCDYQTTEKSAKFQCLASENQLTFGAFKKDLQFVVIGESLIIDEDTDQSNGVIAKIKVGEWFPLELAKQDAATVGLHAKLLKFSDEIKIYFGPAFRNNGFPRSFVETIEKNVGFTIGGPDFQGFQQGKIDLETLLEQAHRETEFMQKVALYCLKNLEFDLLLYDHPILDRYGHYTGGRDFSKLKNGYLATDKNIAEILETIDKNTALFVVSGHGFSESHTSFSLRKVLENIGENTNVTAVGSKLSTHIYLNNRTLGEFEKQKYLQSLKEKLLNFKDEKTGAKIVDKVLFPEEMKRLRIFNEQNSGDLWICLKTGYTFDGFIGQNELTGKPTFIGEHGYFDNSPEAKGLFYFYSPRKIKLSGKTKDSVDVAPIIFEWLRLR